MSLHTLFSPPTVAGSVHSTPDSGDLAERLRSPSGPDLVQQMHQQLDDMQARLRHQAGQGVDSSTYARLQAALVAVNAARDILLRLPVRFDNIRNSPLSGPLSINTRSIP